jgi:hypothetical protein
MENANLFLQTTELNHYYKYTRFMDVQYQLLKGPIAPGGKGVIGVQYATDRVGAFTKNSYCNFKC